MWLVNCVCCCLQASCYLVGSNEKPITTLAIIDVTPIAPSPHSQFLIQSWPSLNTNTGILNEPYRLSGHFWMCLHTAYPRLDMHNLCGEWQTLCIPPLPLQHRYNIGNVGICWQCLIFCFVQSPLLTNPSIENFMKERTSVMSHCHVPLSCKIESLYRTDFINFITNYVSHDLANVRTTRTLVLVVHRASRANVVLEHVMWFFAVESCTLLGDSFKYWY